MEYIENTVSIIVASSEKLRYNKAKKKAYRNR